MPHTQTPRRPPLLFAPDAHGREVAEVLNLSADEVHHVRALRLASGATVQLTDGCGGMWSAHLRDVSGPRISCVLDEPLESAARLPVELAFAVGNKSHTLWLVEKATEFSVTGLWPVEFSRSRSVADAARSPSFWDKAKRRSVSAMKQSRGAWLPRVERPCGLQAFLGSVTDRPAPESDRADVQAGRILLDPSGEPLGSLIGRWSGSPPLLFLVGPEGGATDEERAAVLGSGFGLARLGPSILRFETAAIAAVAVATQQYETARAHLTVARPAPHGAGDTHER